jgi:8-oxo-dGTP pyrophosphatase MutT (NUDIX family)
MFMRESISIVIRKGEGGKDKFLLIKQVPDKPQPFTWLPPSGRIMEGETHEEACAREAKEETGVDVKVIKKVFSMPAEYHADFVHFYLADYVGGKVKIDPGEALDWGWFTIEEMAGMNLMKGTRLFFEKHFKGFRT